MAQPAASRVRPLLAVSALGLLPACNHLFYFPSQVIADTPEYPHRDVRFVTDDGVHLHGWYFPALRGAPRATLVQVHGNAGNVSTHYRSLAWVVEHGHALFTFDYRGYGQSDAQQPTRQGVHRDTVTALRFAFDTWPDVPLIVYGQSLGGAVAVRALADVDRDAVAGVIVEGTFHSYQDVAANVVWGSGLGIPFAGFAYWWVTDDYAPAPHIAKLSPTPLLVIHGTDDPVVRYDLGVAVYHLAEQPKEFWGIPGGGHIDVTRHADGVYRGRLLDWVTGVLDANEGVQAAPSQPTPPPPLSRRGGTRSVR